MRCAAFIFKPLLSLAVAGLVAFTAQAHGPFDHSARVWVSDDNLEVTVTLGPEAAKIFLNDGPEQVRYAGHMESVFPLPASSAARLFEMKLGDTTLTPVKTTVRSDGLEYVFGFFYPRPAAGPLHFNARYLEETPKLTKGALVVVNENDTMLAGKVVSFENHQVDFALPAKAGDSPVVVSSGETNSTIATTSKLPAIAAVVAPSPADGKLLPGWIQGLFVLATLALALLVWLSLRMRNRTSR